MLNSTPVLMLSTGYEPLFQTNWKRALSAIFSGRAEVIETHAFLSIGSSSGPIPFPVKARFTTGIIAARVKSLSVGASLSRRALFLRDKGVCQYCEKKIPLKIGTIDHVVPKSRGGTNAWQNVVWACEKCNQRKGSKMLSESSLKLIKHPRQPSIYEVVNLQVRK
jgi:5-methylcytosine-specific restriction endonuclease McrA